MGNGISKSTWACSHPVKLTYPWLMKYLPVTDADDSCANNVCKCGATGRVTLKVSPPLPAPAQVPTISPAPCPAPRTRVQFRRHTPFVSRSERNAFVTVLVDDVQLL